MLCEEEGKWYPWLRTLLSPSVTHSRTKSSAKEKPLEGLAGAFEVSLGVFLSRILHSARSSAGGPACEGTWFGPPKANSTPEL